MVNRHTIIRGLLLVVAAGSVAVMMLCVQTASPYLSGHDSYYHAKMGLLLPGHGFMKQLPWMHWTAFRETFINHYYGYHALLSPFVCIADKLVGNAMAGAKALNVLLGALIGVTLWLLLRQQKVPASALWVLLLGCAPWHFWLRMSYTRAPVPNLLLLLVGLLMALRRKAIGLGIVAFLATHLYSGGLFIVSIPAALLVGHLVAGQMDRKVFYMILAVGAGIIAGLLTSPYFPSNFSFLAHEAMSMVLGQVQHTGSEWRPFETWYFVTMAAPFLALWIIGVAIRLRGSDDRMNGNSIAIAILHLGFLFLTMKSRHFIEYWPPFALLHFADLAAPALRRFTGAAPRRRPAMAVVTVIAVIATVVGSRPGLAQARDHARSRFAHDRIRSALEYLGQHSEQGSLVFTDDWDVFPPFFFYNHHNYYMWGLDPVYTKEAYPTLHRRWELISRGKVPTRLHSQGPDVPANRVTIADIHKEFSADYVIVMDDHRSMYKDIVNSPDLFTMIYPEGHDADAWQPKIAVFKVNQNDR